MDFRNDKRKLLIISLTVAAIFINSRFVGRGNVGSETLPIRAAEYPLIRTEYQSSEVAEVEVARIPVERSEVVIRRHEPTYDPEAERRRALEEETRREQEYLTRYLRTSDEPTGSGFAIIAANEEKRESSEIKNALVRVFAKGKSELSTALFTSAFISEGLFEETFNGSMSAVQRLKLPTIVEGLVLAKQAVEYRKNPRLENVITASMRLDIRAIPFSSAEESQGWTFTASGVGFRNAEARMQAEERLLKQLHNATNLVLRAASK